ISTDPLVVETSLGRFQPDCKRSTSLNIGNQSTILLRPSGASITEQITEFNSIHGVVEDVTYQGEYYRVSLHCKGDGVLVFHLAQAPKIGKDLTLTMAPESVDCLETA
ncbi:MAG: TOBE domain-containing protein, partial [Anaerolineaceae bacterium]|nr:TOBE domain-containing protein [Anaerolineaceae bacterium]